MSYLARSNMLAHQVSYSSAVVLMCRPMSCSAIGDTPGLRDMLTHQVSYSVTDTSNCSLLPRLQRIEKEVLQRYLWRELSVCSYLSYEVHEMSPTLQVCSS